MNSLFFQVHAMFPGSYKWKAKWKQLEIHSQVQFRMFHPIQLAWILYKPVGVYRVVPNPKISTQSKEY